MENVVEGWNLGRSFGYLTKQYIGTLSAKLEGVPVQRYYYPLYIIGKSSGKICQQQLADQLLMDKVSIVRILNALTEDGYIERKVNPEDRREHLLHITKKGKPWVKSIENSLKETDAQFPDGARMFVERCAGNSEGVEKMASEAGSGAFADADDAHLFASHDADGELREFDF